MAQENAFKHENRVDTKSQHPYYVTIKGTQTNQEPSLLRHTKNVEMHSHSIIWFVEPWIY